MATTINVSRILDTPRWQARAAQPNTALGPSAAGVAVCMDSDLRGRKYADPHIWCNPQVTQVIQAYNTVLDAWLIKGYSAVPSGNFQAMGWKFVPSQGPSGTIAAGATSTSVVLSTALPASVESNQLANRGDRLGYIIRIIDNAAGGSGKIEERRVVSNTSGTTPTITLSEALSFTPTTGSRYEFLSGALYLLTTGASKSWYRIDVMTGASSAALSTSLLPATVGTSFTDLVTLDEQYVPYLNYPGEGFVLGATTVDAGGSGEWAKRCLVATATAAGTITGQAAGGDSTVLLNQYRNFQIRIVEDTATPTAVGQRRRITSHTAGASAVYTLGSNWTVTPSATAKFVIENDNDKIIFLTNSTTVYNYNIASNTWDTTTWAARGSAAAIGLGSAQAFGIVDTSNRVRNSFIYSLRGTGTGGNPVDVLDIAAAATGSWSSFAMTPNFFTSLIPSGTSFGFAYDALSNEGRYAYFFGPTALQTGPQTVWRLDFKTKTLLPFSPIPISISNNSGNVSNLMGMATLIDGSTTLSFLFGKRQQSIGGEWYSCPLIF
jgi:hypothetical protein